MITIHDIDEITATLTEHPECFDLMLRIFDKSKISYILQLSEIYHKVKAALRRNQPIEAKTILLNPAILMPEKLPEININPEQITSEEFIEILASVRTCLIAAEFMKTKPGLALVQFK